MFHHYPPSYPPSLLLQHRSALPPMSTPLFYQSPAKLSFPRRDLQETQDGSLPSVPMFVSPVITMPAHNQMAKAMSLSGPLLPRFSTRAPILRGLFEGGGAASAFERRHTTSRTGSGTAVVSSFDTGGGKAMPIPNKRHHVPCQTSPSDTVKPRKKSEGAHKRQKSSRSGHSRRTSALQATPIPTNDIVVAHEFIAKAIVCLGPQSPDVPTQKQFLRLGMTTTKQQKARRFLRAAGAVVVNTRTQISSRFQTLQDIQDFLQRNFPTTNKAETKQPRLRLSLKPNGSLEVAGVSPVALSSSSGKSAADLTSKAEPIRSKHVPGP